MSSEWFRKAVIYHILIDRFAGFPEGKKIHDDKPVFCGGTIRGIAEKLTYLQELGITAIWLSPFYKTTAYHGYHITDYFSVEPGFGSLHDLQKLIKKAHEMKIRIIVDFVPNHCSNKHPFFIDAANNPESEYYRWFYFTKWPDNYRAFFEFYELPKINLDYPSAAQHLIDSALYWTKMGIDGFRVDHVAGVSKLFLNKLSEAVKQENPEAVLFGEAWMTNPGWKYMSDMRLSGKYIKRIFGQISQESVQKEYVGILDGVLDFQARDLLIKYIAHNDQPSHKAEKLKRKLMQHYKKYSDGYFLPVFLDNHDTNRFLFECDGDVTRLKRALSIIFHVNQPVILYYGTEAGMTHRKPVKLGKAFSELEARKIMNWEMRNENLYDFIRMLCKY